VSDDLKTILKDVKDVFGIFPEKGSQPLPGLDQLSNPFILTGTRPRFHEKVIIDATKGHYFRVWPKTATGKITVIGRTKPDNFDPQDEVSFDADVLVSWATWDYLVDDGHNPDQADKHQKFWVDRLQQLKNDDTPIYTSMSDPAQSEIPNQWFVV
jgi:hypothetical protein